MQYDLGRKAAEISALSSKDLLEKYEYLTGEDLGHKPSVFEKAKFEYSPLGMVLANNTKSKTKKKRDKYLLYNSQQSYSKLKNIDEFKELSLDSMYKRLNDFQKRFNKLKNVIPQTDENKDLQEKVLNGVGDLYNELYYIYKDKYNEEKNGLTKRHKEI